MRLTFHFQPVDDLAVAVRHYVDLGWTEAWREGEHTVALQMPDVDVRLMLDDAGGFGGAGPMYLVDDLTSWVRANAMGSSGPVTQIPGGEVVEIAAPGHTYYVFSLEPSR